MLKCGNVKMGSCLNGIPTYPLTHSPFTNYSIYLSMHSPFMHYLSNPFTHYIVHIPSIYIKIFIGSKRRTLIINENINTLHNYFSCQII